MVNRHDINSEIKRLHYVYVYTEHKQMALDRIVELQNLKQLYPKVPWWKFRKV